MTPLTTSDPRLTAVRALNRVLPGKGDGESLREVLREWLDHRREVLLRRSRNRLGIIEKRLEVLAGFLIAYLNIDEVIRIHWMHGLVRTLIGIAIAVPSLLLLSVIAENSELGLVPSFNLGLAAWISIGALVPASSLIAMLTARATVINWGTGALVSLSVCTLEATSTL